MLGIIIFVFFGALATGIIGGVVFGIIRLIVLTARQSAQRRQQAAWANYQAHNPPWLAQQLPQQPWVPQQQPAEPTMEQMLGPEAWASKQEMDKLWAQVEEDRRQHPTQQ